MVQNSPLTFCISTWNNLNYLKIAIKSVRSNSFYSTSPFIIHAENCDDGTDKWLEENKDLYNLEIYIDKNDIPLGIGGGMNFCASKVKTEYIMFLHSDFYVTKNWDKCCMDIVDQNPNDKLWVSSQRIEPNMFGGETRHGTVIIPKDSFGAYWDDFDIESFENWVEQIQKINKPFTIPKGEGVSGLIKKEYWDEIGGNDKLFAPTSWDDMDLFLRMVMKNYKFILTSKSIVWHFGARGSHRLEENGGKSSRRQQETEQININKWIQKWGSLPTFNEVGMINGLKIK
jgi:GT2 family glycosyltransferase